jgi:protein arginine kinase activator
MDCQNCGQREALIHLTEIKEGQVVNRWLCAQCAKEKQANRRPHDDGDGDFFGPTIPSPAPGNTPADEAPDPLGEFLRQEASQHQNLDPQGVDTCPACGFKLAVFFEGGRLGCPGCYRAFASNLRPILSRLHGQTIHLGKVPRTNPQGPNTAAELTRARIALTKAVAAEEYEEAARLRDHLKILQDRQDRDSHGNA